MGRPAKEPRDHGGDSKPVMSAIIVGVLLPGDSPQQLTEDLDELAALLQTLGVITGGRIIQKRQRLTAKCLLGTGKVEEIAALAKDVGAKMVVFDRHLAAPQVRNIEEMTKCEVLDRSGVILEIFSKHARTNQSKTQVEIARLEYLLPRMTGAWTHLDRQRGAGNLRGMGEKQIEVDRRRARDRIARLKSQLQQISKDRATQRKSRRNELKVALVGYTNSGKTTLMNALTHAKLQAKDALFVTLDANVRTIDPTTRPKILLSDTVGFIRNLPHSLVESFKSTLDEVLEADMLLHVVDVSHSSYRIQMETTQQVLNEIGAGEIPTIVVFNKLDNLDDPILPKVLRQAYKGSICVSAYSEDDIVRMRKHVYDFFGANFLRAQLRIPADDTTALSQVYNSCIVTETDYETPDFVVIEVKASRAELNKLSAFIVKEYEPQNNSGRELRNVGRNPRNTFG